MKIYVASSWRNCYQPEVVKALREAGHEVYDFRNPPTQSGFGWDQINPNWENWTTEEYKGALRHPLAVKGYESDINGMMWADGCVLVLPCGRSAHAEAGWFAGAGKRVFAYLPEQCEPELMYKMFTGGISGSLDKILRSIKWVEDEPVEEYKEGSGPYPYEDINA